MEMIVNTGKGYVSATKNKSDDNTKNVKSRLKKIGDKILNKSYREINKLLINEL